MFHEKLIDELRSYYRTLSFHAVRTPFNPLKEKMDRFAEQNPGLSPLQLKAAQYEIIAEHFTPVLFRNDPFFYETGLKVAEYNGHTRLSSGGWLFLRNAHLIREACPEECAHYEQAGKLGLHLTYGFFDYDHHCFPFSRLLKLGLSGIAAELQEGRQKIPNPHSRSSTTPRCGESPPSGKPRKNSPRPPGRNFHPRSLPKKENFWNESRQPPSACHGCRRRPSMKGWRFSGSFTNSAVSSKGSACPFWELPTGC